MENRLVELHEWKNKHKKNVHEDSLDLNKIVGLFKYKLLVLLNVHLCPSNLQTKVSDCKVVTSRTTYEQSIPYNV
jgi:hypothetical protein